MPEVERRQPPSLAGELPDFTLLELADRLLNRGVVLVGEATISVAGISLIYLGLNVVLTAVENLVEQTPPRTCHRSPRLDAHSDSLTMRRRDVLCTACSAVDALA